MSRVPPIASPKVSIVIPTYNQAHFLKECLDSVIAQTVTDWEAIVVNNFSEDTTREVVLSYGDSRITLIDFANHGVIAASRNVGWRQAKAEWVAFLDSDDLWDCRKLEICLAATGDTVDVVSHPERFLKDDKIVQQTQPATPSRASFEGLLLEGNCLSPSAILVRRTLLDRAGGYCEDRDIITAEDHDLWLRLAALGARMVHLPQALADYRLHGEQNFRSVERHMLASLAVFDRHAPSLSPSAPLRCRRARARIIYGAGRTEQKAGRGGPALRLLARAFGQWPFLPRLPVAAILAVVAMIRPR